MSSTLHKTPPHSVDMEVAVIGACLLRSEAIDETMEVINPEDFYLEAHRTIMKAIFHLHSNNKPVDILTLGGLLKQHDKLDQVGGLTYINTLLSAVATPANLKTHAHIIKDMALRRAVIGICLKAVDTGYENKDNSHEYATGILRQLEEAIRTRVKNPIVSVGDTIIATMTEISKQIDEDQLITGVPTGYTDLDKMTAGLQRKDLIIIGGRPSMGKTALALNIMENAARMGKQGLIFSLEMSVDQLNRRLLSSSARIECHKLRFPRLLEDKEVGKLIEACSDVMKLPIWVDDSAEIALHDIKARARRFARHNELAFIMVDYLQIMRSVDREIKRDRQIAEITGGLKALAKELDVPVVGLSMVNRDCEKREDKRPRKADLKDSGALEQDADLILLLYREAAYNFDADATAEVIVDKNRNGPTGLVKLTFRKELVRFESHADSEVEGQPEDHWYHNN